jgi:hypothetical protein
MKTCSPVLHTALEEMLNKSRRSSTPKPLRHFAREINFTNISISLDIAAPDYLSPLKFTHKYPIKNLKGE